MKTIEGYISHGLDYEGYLEPEITSNDIYPDYIRAEVEETVEAVQKIQGYNTATFGFMTDPHYATKFKYTHLIRLRRTLNAYKMISQRAQSDFLVIGGDLFTNGTKKYVSDCLREFRAELNGIRYMPVNGNHDDNSIWDIACIKSEKAENHLTPEERYTLFFNHLYENGAVFNEKNKGLYYYTDNRSAKVRYIFLDSIDIPYEYDENGSLLYSGQGFYDYSKDQLDWLINDALNFNETGWGVVIFQHVPPIVLNRDLGENLSRISVIHDILKARSLKQNIDFEHGEGRFKKRITADFSNYKSCDIIAVITGHIHSDESRKVDNIQYISTMNSVMYVNGGNPLMRFDGTKNEILFDIGTINRKERTLTLTRVGAGEDRVFSF